MAMRADTRSPLAAWVTRLKSTKKGKCVRQDYARQSSGRWSNSAVWDERDASGMFRLPCCNFVKVIGPPLHHPLALGEVLRVIVSRPNVIALAVGELAFDYICAKTILVQNRTGGTAEAMPGGT